MKAVSESRWRAAGRTVTVIGAVPFPLAPLWGPDATGRSAPPNLAVSQSRPAPAKVRLAVNAVGLPWAMIGPMVVQVGEVGVKYVQGNCFSKSDCGFGLPMSELTQLHCGAKENG